MASLAPSGHISYTDMDNGVVKLVEACGEQFLGAIGHLTPRADKSVVKSFGMGDRCSFFHLASIGLILRNTLVRSFSSD